MKVYSRRWPLAVSLVVAACIGGLAAGEEAGSGDSGVAARHREKDEQMFKKQDEQIAQARELRKEERFDEAVTKFQEVLAELELLWKEYDSYKARARYNEYDRELRLLYRDRAKWLLAGAKTAFAEKRYEDGIRLANRVALDQNISNDLRREGESLRQYGNGLMNEARVNSEINAGIEKTAADLNKKNETIKKLFEEAKVFYNAKRYSNALDRIEQIYILDPFNMDALALAGDIYRQYYTYGFYRHKADVQSMVAVSEWQWAEPMFVLDKTETKTTSEVKRPGNDRTLAKLDKIIFPRFKFQAASISSVLDYIERRVKTDDPELKISRQNIPEDLSDRVKITMDLSDTSLASLIEYICMASGLKYVVTENGVEIGVNVSNLETMNIPVLATTRDAIMAESGESGGSDDVGGGAADPGLGGGGGGAVDRTAGGGGDSDSMLGSLGSTSTSNVKMTSAMLKAFFTKHGVTFGPGSSITYDARMQVLRVRNTPANLRRMIDLNKEMEAALDKPLVMIELKSLEISDGDLQELGFEWTFNGLRESAGNTWSFGMGQYAKPGQSLAPQRQSITGVDAEIVNNLNIFPVLFGTQHPFGSDTAMNISLTINALSRSNRSETLNAPKLLTSDNTRAWLKMGKTYRFPESWDEAEVEIETNDNSSRTTITPPVPDFGDDTDIGVDFSVTPRILEGNQTIELKINPKFTSYLGKDEYAVNIYGYDVTPEVSPTGAITPRRDTHNYYFTIWRPIISERSVDAMVQVNDGETLVLGGMIENEALSRTDKFPILGDLPLIGRLFQTQSEETSRTNLLIFVTARLVNPTGEPVKSNLNLGSPDFKR